LELNLCIFVDICSLSKIILRTNFPFKKINISNVIGIILGGFISLIKGHVVNVLNLLNYHTWYMCNSIMASLIIFNETQVDLIGLDEIEENAILL